MSILCQHVNGDVKTKLEKSFDLSPLPTLDFGPETAYCCSADTTATMIVINRHTICKVAKNEKIMNVLDVAPDSDKMYDIFHLSSVVWLIATMGISIVTKTKTVLNSAQVHLQLLYQCRAIP